MNRLRISGDIPTTTPLDCGDFFGIGNGGDAFLVESVDPDWDALYVSVLAVVEIGFSSMVTF